MVEFLRIIFILLRIISRVLLFSDNTAGFCCSIRFSSVPISKCTKSNERKDGFIMFLYSRFDSNLNLFLLAQHVLKYETD